MISLPERNSLNSSVSWPNIEDIISIRDRRGVRICDLIIIILDEMMEVKFSFKNFYITIEIICEKFPQMFCVVSPSGQNFDEECCWKIMYFISYFNFSRQICFNSNVTLQWKIHVYFAVRIFELKKAL